MVKKTALADLGFVGGRLEGQMSRSPFGDNFFGRLENQFPRISFGSDGERRSAGGPAHAERYEKPAVQYTKMRPPRKKSTVHAVSSRQGRSASAFACEFRFQQVKEAKKEQTMFSLLGTL